jgi:predicted nucleic acid-binding Zn ribbon protein
MQEMKKERKSTQKMEPYAIEALIVVTVFLVQDIVCVLTQY